MTVEGNQFAARAESARAEVTGAIRQASATTGTKFEYLLSAAKLESSLNPAATSSTSSARGLYQFIEQTWLGTVKEAGPALGYSRLSDAISKSDGGTYSVADPAMRQKILQLRDDPAISAAMAGVLTKSNGFKLGESLGRRPSDSELYIAHVMGVGGATRLIGAVSETPQIPAAALFPGPAAANPTIFYDRAGQPRTVLEVYQLMTARYQAVAAATRQSLAAEPVRAGAAGPTGQQTQPVGPAAPVTLAPAPAPPSVDGLRGTDPQPSEPPPTPVRFQSLFQTGSRGEPVSSAVRSLWGNTPAAPPSSAPAPGVRTPDLFSDRFGDFRS